MKSPLALTTFLLSTLITPSISQGPNLCANMVFSARYDNLFAPSIGLLQTQCQNLCASARNAGINTFGRCALQGVSDIEVQLANLVRTVRCQERCTGQTAWEGDCGCTVDANDVLVVQDEDILEECDASVLVNGVFRDRGWTNKYQIESAARACPSGGGPNAAALQQPDAFFAESPAAPQPASLFGQPDALTSGQQLNAFGGQQPDALGNNFGGAQLAALGGQQPDALTGGQQLNALGGAFGGQQPDALGNAFGGDELAALGGQQPAGLTGGQQLNGLGGQQLGNLAARQMAPTPVAR